MAAQLNETFNPNEHITKLPRWVKDEYGNSKKVEDDYLEVKWRLVWFRDRYPNGTIQTEEIIVDLDKEITVERKKWNSNTRKNDVVMVTGKGYARYRAIVSNGEGGTATGTKTESAVDFPDFVEKAETGAIGRALAALGFGTQFTGDEFNEAHRIVDTPVKHDNPKEEQPKSAPTTPKIPIPVANEKEETSLASEQQISSIRKLCEHLHKPAPDGLNKLTFFGARKVIAALTAEYKEARNNKQAS